MIVIRVADSESKVTIHMNIVYLPETITNIIPSRVHIDALMSPFALNGFPSS